MDIKNLTVREIKDWISSKGCLSPEEIGVLGSDARASVKLAALGRSQASEESLGPPPPPLPAAAGL